ncbi:MAG: type II toxin-antitoxin system MqsA family antitoxin [Faecalibacterium sp.]
MKHKKEDLNYCPCCDQLVATKIIEKNEIFTVKGKEIEIVSQIATCVICGEELFDEHLDGANIVRAYDKYKQEMNLLSAQEICEIRKKYSLSQALFAKILGLGEKTITRYENGAIQDVAQNNLILLMRTPSNFKKLLAECEGKLTEEEKQLAQIALDKLGETTVVTLATAAYSFARPYKVFCGGEQQYLTNDLNITDAS